MSIFSSILGGIKGAKSIYYALKKPVPKSIKTVVKTLASGAGVVGTYAAADVLAGQLSKGITGPGGFGLPALNVGGQVAGGLSALTSRAGASIQQAMPDVLDTSVLKVFYRAPKGYVIVRDPATGSVVAVRKAIAKAYHLWRPARKPPISASDWHHYQRNQALEKKLLKIAAPAIRHHHKRAAPVSGRKGK
jgi:hypothetical protein